MQVFRSFPCLFRCRETCSYMVQFQYLEQLLQPQKKTPAHASHLLSASYPYISFSFTPQFHTAALLLTSPYCDIYVTYLIWTWE